MRLDETRVLEAASRVSLIVIVFGWIFVVAGVFGGLYLWDKLDSGKAAIAAVIEGLFQAAIAWAIGYGLRLGIVVVERLSDIHTTARSAKGLIQAARAQEKARSAGGP